MNVMDSLFKTKTITGVCAEHGPWTAQLPESIPYSGKSLCSPCCERASRAEDERQQAAQSVERNRTRISALMDRSAIPALHADARMYSESPRHDAMLAPLRKFVANFIIESESGRSFLLHGTTGTGKSEAAAAVLRDVARQHMKGVLFAKQSEIGMRIRQAMNGSKTESEYSVVKTFAEIDLLCIDELGVGKNTEAEVTTIADLISTRHENLMPTIVTTNKTPAEIQQILGERLIDRMRSDNWAWLSFNWPSYRGARVK